MFGHGKNTPASTAMVLGQALVTLADQCNSTWDLIYWTNTIRKPWPYDVWPCQEYPCFDGHVVTDQYNSTWDLYTGQIQLENFPDNEF